MAAVPISGCFMTRAAMTSGAANGEMYVRSWPNVYFLFFFLLEPEAKRKILTNMPTMARKTCGIRAIFSPASTFLAR